MDRIVRHPSWLKIKLPGGEGFTKIKAIIDDNKVNTVCTEARCPNKAECWGKGVFTFLILGDICTRNCSFCGVISGRPTQTDYDEPFRVAKISKELDLKYVVITSVDRDDLEDGGSSIFAKTIELVRLENPFCRIEVLIPDFKGDERSLDKIITVKPDVLAHNLETVHRLYSRVKRKSNYENSLKVLDYSKQNGMITKSGFMVGLGETEDDILDLMEDLRKVKCDILTIGQYLQPSGKQLKVEKYYTPEEFEKLKEIGLKKGFGKVESGPFVRSSYHAEESFNNSRINLIK